MRSSIRLAEFKSLLAGSVTLEKLLNHTEPWFPLPNGDITMSNLIGWQKVYMGEAECSVWGWAHGRCPGNACIVMFFAHAPYTIFRVRNSFLIIDTDEDKAWKWRTLLWAP